MGAYKYIAETLQKEYAERSPVYRSRITVWRKSPPVERVERPTNITRARTLGYKAKIGYVVVRSRVKRGSRKRPKPMGGRKAKSNYRFTPPGLSYQRIAEQRVNHNYPNLEVLNSYWAGDDGNNTYYEVILADPTKLELSSLKRRGRAFRGLTSAGQKGRPSHSKTMNKQRRNKLHNARLAKVHGRRAAAARALL
ncbi:MAG: 50S ribosomal protein L15e [Candidatus Micrarchaeota archaeon]